MSLKEGILIDSRKPSHFLAGKKIAIVGGGIAGPAFAVALLRTWSSVTSTQPPLLTIFERDSEQWDASRAGYSLSLRSDGFAGGLQSLQQLGLLEEIYSKSFQASKSSQASQSETCGVAIWDKGFNRILQPPARTPPAGLPAATLQITRSALRKTLIDALPAGLIQWETSVTGVTRLADGVVQVQTQEGNRACDLLIASDGASSRIRSVLKPEVRLSYAGAACIMAQANFPDGLPAKLDGTWGSVMGSGNGTGLFVGPVSETSVVYSLSYRHPVCRLPMKPPIANQMVPGLIKEVLDLGRPYEEPFRSMVHATDPGTLNVYNAMDSLPFAHEQESIGMPVVYIGDSNHAMSVFSGNGANMALMDGVQLAERLCLSDSCEEALIAYDALSMPRARSAIRLSHVIIALMHARGLAMLLSLSLLRLLGLIQRLVTGFGG